MIQDIKLISYNYYNKIINRICAYDGTVSSTCIVFPLTLIVFYTAVWLQTKLICLLSFWSWSSCLHWKAFRYGKT